MTINICTNLIILDTYSTRVLCYIRASDVNTGPACSYTSLQHTDPLNKSNLDVMERAQFVLCLDRGLPSTSTSPLCPHSPYSDPQYTMVLNRCMHGNGSKFNSANRWFDSVVQVRVLHCCCISGPLHIHQSDYKHNLNKGRYSDSASHT